MLKFFFFSVLCYGVLFQLDKASGFTCPSDGFFGNPGQCVSDYWACFGGVAYPLRCAENMVYDAVQQRCVPFNEASCNNSFQCPSDSDGFFPNPGLCISEHWICVNGDAYPQKCPGNSVFDPEALVCFSPDHASCKA